MPTHTSETSRSKAAVLARLRRLAINLHWTWDPEAQRLFAWLDPKLWDATHHNPIKLLKLLPPERRELAGNDREFSRRLETAEHELSQYLRQRTWFDETAQAIRPRPLIAYLCAEHAIHECLPIYSGGLGVLAGDHVKSASDLGLPFVAVGLLYRCGY